MNTETTSPVELYEQTKARILHTLEIYPFISSSMVHISIGSSTPTLLWRPLLQELIEDGLVLETVRVAKTPADRSQSYTIYHLPANPYTFEA